MQYKNIYPTPTERSQGINTREYIVLHHTGTQEGTIKWVLNWLAKRSDYASCHYVIDVNGDTYKIWNDTDILWHAWVSSWDGKNDMNKYSIGIEIIWPLSNGAFTPEQKESVKNLVKYLCDIHKISKENVVRHKDISPGRKTDPKDTLWSEEYESYNLFIDSIFMSKDNETLQRENDILRKRADEVDELLKKALKANKPNDYNF